MKINTVQTLFIYLYNATEFLEFLISKTLKVDIQYLCSDSSIQNVLKFYLGFFLEFNF